VGSVEIFFGIITKQTIILIQTDVGRESDVAGALAAIPGIDSVATTLGP
jgi:hypothetical protein